MNYEFYNENPEKERENILVFLHSVNAEPEIIYAFEKTGIVVTDTNKDKLTKKQIQDWNTAIADFIKPQ